MSIRRPIGRVGMDYSRTELQKIIDGDKCDGPLLGYEIVIVFAVAIVFICIVMALVQGG